MNWNGRKRPAGDRAPALPRLVFLALCFAAGIVLGQVLAERFSASSGAELERYLTDYVTLSGEAVPGKRTVLTALVIYFRYPLLAFFLGFASLGVVSHPGRPPPLTVLLVPFRVLLYGGLRAQRRPHRPGGAGGAVPFDPAVLLFAGGPLSGDVGGPGQSVVWERQGGGARGVWAACWRRLAIVCGVLLLGVCVELFLAPALLESVLERVLI